MLFIVGKRIARIGSFSDTEHICYPCKAYDREINVYQSYFHICFIPVFPLGKKQFEMRCRNCGDETRLETVLTKYARRTKSPFYLYSALILFVGLTVFWFYWNENFQKRKIEYIVNLKLGDVYTIAKDKNGETFYYFLRISGISGDTVKLLHNNLNYGGFVSKLANDDYFVKEDTVWYRKKDIREMLDRGEIYAVDRDYGEGTGFHRFQ
jgi:hypothetical protein